MAWTTEKRYRRYEDWTQDEVQQIKENIAKSPWRASYHVEPQTGLLNDPNGFSYFDGKWIVFYQNFPFGAAHGLKCWVQLESDDLVHFTETGLRVLPDTALDSHGLALPCSLTTSSFSSTPAMFVMRIGYVIPIRLAPC